MIRPLRSGSCRAGRDVRSSTSECQPLSAFRTIRTPNRLLWLMLGLTFALLLITLFFGPARQLFGFSPVTAAQFGWCALAALVSVGWIEIYKLVLAWRQRTA